MNYYRKMQCGGKKKTHQSFIYMTMNDTKYTFTNTRTQHQMCFSCSSSLALL